MKQDLYQQLNLRKKQGETLEWDKITKEQLKELFREYPDSAIADLYNIKKEQVRAKRYKWNIKQMNYIIEDYLNENDNKKLFEGLNQSAKNRLLDKNNINTISIALTHYLFRNGVVEDMHAAGKLSQDDMKALNKYMVNKIAGILETISNGEWLKLELLLNYYQQRYGKNWDTPISDTEEIELEYQIFLKQIQERQKNSHQNFTNN